LLDSLLQEIIDIKINVEKFSKLEKQMGPPGDIRPKARLKLKYIKKTKPHSWLGKNDASKGPTKNVEDDLMTLYTVPSPPEKLRDSPVAGEDFLDIKENLVPRASRRRSPRVPGFLSQLDNSGDSDQESVVVTMGKRKHSDKEVPKRKSKRRSVDVSEDIIEVGDSDVEENDEVSTSRRTTRSSSTMSDQFKLCVYPENNKADSVTVCVSDYRSLEHDTFLNDIIIDFYLTYLMNEKLSKEDQSTVHIFSTMFYKSLTTGLKKKSEDSESDLNTAERRHAKVKGWTKNVDLFKKDILVFPICEHSHWYLVIAIKPGMVQHAEGSEERTTHGEPLFLVLDSLGGNKSAAVTNIRKYLKVEWSQKMNEFDEVDFSSEQMKTVRPKKPEQENFSDCGIFLLHYVEKIFLSLPHFFWRSSLERATGVNWFSAEEISKKRGEIAELIRILARPILEKSNQLLPVLNFESTTPVTRSKRRQKINFPNIDDYLTDDEDFYPATDNLMETGIAASGFYGERSGLRSSKRLEDDGRQKLRDREKRRLRREKEERKELPELEASRKKLTEEIIIQPKPNETSTNDKFDRLRDKEPAKGKVRKMASLVPNDKTKECSMDKTEDKVVRKELNSISNPMDVKSRADLHGKKTKKHFSVKVMPSDRPRKNPALATFRAEQAGASKPIPRQHGKNEAALQKEVSEILEQLEDGNESGDLSVTENMKKLRVDESKVSSKISSTVNAEDVISETNSDIVSEVSSVVPFVHEKEDASDEKDEVSSIVTSSSIVIEDENSKNAIEEEVNGEDNCDIKEALKKADNDEVTVLENENVAFDIKKNNIEEVTENVDDGEISIMEDDKVDGDPDKKEIEEPLKEAEDEDVKIMENDESISSTPKIPYRSRQGSPEVLQITKSIPEDSEVKITLTKSPSNKSIPTQKFFIDLDNAETSHKGTRSTSPVFKKRGKRRKEKESSRDNSEVIDSSDAESDVVTLVPVKPTKPPLKIDISDEVRSPSKRSSWKAKLLPSEASLQDQTTTSIDLSQDDDDDFIPSSQPEITPRSSQRPKRKKHFPRLSDIDKAKLKNKPYAEREKAFDRESLRQGGRRVTSIDLVDENT